jgi:hypothetical protein
MGTEVPVNGNLGNLICRGIFMAEKVGESAKHPPATCVYCMFLILWTFEVCLCLP